LIIIIFYLFFFSFDFSSFLPFLVHRRAVFRIHTRVRAESARENTYDVVLCTTSSRNDHLVRRRQDKIENRKAAIRVFRPDGSLRRSRGVRDETMTRSIKNRFRDRKTGSSCSERSKGTTTLLLLLLLLYYTNRRKHKTRTIYYIHVLQYNDDDHGDYDDHDDDDDDDDTSNNNNNRPAGCFWWPVRSPHD